MGSTAEMTDERGKKSINLKTEQQKLPSFNDSDKTGLKIK